MRQLVAFFVSSAIVAGLTACCCNLGFRGQPVVINVPPPPIPQPPPPLPVPPQPVTPKPAAPPGVAGKKTVDLIPLINTGVDAVENRRWEIKNNELHCPDGGFVPRIQIPYQPPAEYDFTVVFSQPALRNGISMIMPKPDGNDSFFWFVGGANNSDYGFHANPNIEGSQPNLLQPNVACTTTVKVRKTGVKGFINGKEMKSHPTVNDLICDGWRTIPNKTLLALACDDPTVFHFVRVVEISGQGKKQR